MMKTIYFIINKNGNHKSIMKNGSGASEVLFYLIALSLSSYFNVIIYNRDSPCKIDNIEYRFLPNNIDIDINTNSVVIVQRHFNMLIDLHKTNSTNKYILWSHDYLEGDFNHLSENYKPSYIDNYFMKYNIKIVSVSYFHKDNILKYLPNVSVEPIYNALYPEYFIKDNNIDYDKNKIIFASNWGKGLDRVLNIGRHYYNKNKHFKLILIKPKYCEWDPELHEYPFIEKRGCIENKKEYCKILQSCLCVFSTSYPETFGCVFAEALHLGVPVIGDNSVQAGFHEIIPQDFMCNFNNPNEVINKIENLRTNRPNVALGQKFYDKSVINEWIKLLEYLYLYMYMDNSVEKLIIMCDTRPIYNKELYGETILYKIFMINLNYAFENNYKFYFFEIKDVKDINNKDRKPAWFKIMALKYIANLYSDLEICYIDSDAVFSTLDNKLNKIISFNDKNKIFYFWADEKGENHPNSGVIILKKDSSNCKKTMEILNNWYNCSEISNWWEQDSLQKIIKNKYKEHITIISSKKFSCHHQSDCDREQNINNNGKAYWNHDFEGDFIYHFWSSLKNQISTKTILDGIIDYYNISDFKLLSSEEISLSNIKFILHNFETI